MPPEPLTVVEARAVRIRVVGRVQGLGVRPAAARLAMRLGLAGSVANTSDGLEIELEGATNAVRRYLDEFADALPAGAAVDRLHVEPARLQYRREFHIAPRCDEGTEGAALPLDRIACKACLHEVRDPVDRRYGYPFASCTACGPRYSIVEAMPYDRPATTMRGFNMCSACLKEYREPEDRRFHAQTAACPRCGPQVRLFDGAGRTAVGDEALRGAAVELRNGRIVAMKGLGGYQLLVDATCPGAVRRLRQRKGRPSKPLAVLVGSLAEAERLAWLNDAERRLLCDPAGPIVVVRRRADIPLTADVAPGFDSVGLLLPTTPLHALLCDRVGRPLVCTSGNREGEPLADDVRRAETELRDIADVWLHHDRPIARPIDDSVVRVIAGSPCFVRLARGYAPHVLPLPPASLTEPLVALGGEQKAAVAVWNGRQAVLGPHVGDLTGAGACERWVEQLAATAGLYGVSLEAADVVHDQHPEYFSTGWAQQFRRRQIVQHHHAHIAAVLLEHGELDREVLGLAWDGTGYGDDGTVWGGETLRATSTAYRRVGRLRPFPLIGGAAAIREPWRVATVLVREALGGDAAATLERPSVSPTRRDEILKFATRPTLFPAASSMGRLFDAVASLALGLTTAADEGRPAMLLEAACDRDASGAYAFVCNDAEVDWRPVVAEVVLDLRRGEPPGVVAMRFHRAVADLVASIAAAHPKLPLVTSGGVFQNGMLGELLVERLDGRRSAWLRPQIVPPGDGGLAAGQLAVATGRALANRRGC